MIGPATDTDVPTFWRTLGLPGLADIHVHFMPDRVLDKVWTYFAAAQTHYGRAWPVTYQQDEPTRLSTVRALGLRGIPSLCYAHKPGMSTWLNAWCNDFASRVPDAVHSATLFPEPGVADYVAAALDNGAKLFKTHAQVGDFSPADPLLDPAWALLEDAGAPIVLHAGSAPIAGRYTGPDAVEDVLRRFPRLTLVIAHLGMSEYDAFAGFAERFANVHLDTTMAGTDFVEEFAPLPPGHLSRLADLGDRVVLGADFPNIPYPYAHQLQALATWDLGDDWLRAVLWENGARLMGLSS